MGKNTLSTTQLAHQLIANLKPLSEMLPPDKRRIMEKKIFEYILQERVAISNATDLMPLEPALIVIILEEHKANQHEYTELYRQLDELQRAIDELKRKA